MSQTKSTPEKTSKTELINDEIALTAKYSVRSERWIPDGTYVNNVQVTINPNKKLRGIYAGKRIIHKDDHDQVFHVITNFTDELVTTEDCHEEVMYKIRTDTLVRSQELDAVFDDAYINALVQIDFLGSHTTTSGYKMRQFQLHILEWSKY